MKPESERKENKKNGQLWQDIEDACKYLPNVEFRKHCDNKRCSIKYYSQTMNWISKSGVAVLIHEMKNAMNEDKSYIALVNPNHEFNRTVYRFALYFDSEENGVFEDSEPLHSHEDVKNSEYKSELEAYLMLFKLYNEHKQKIAEKPSEAENILYGMIDAHGYEHTYKLLQKAQERHHS